MNNKGFAISSVIYGLSILGMMIVFIIMGTISSNRKNIVEQAKHVEKNLLNLSKASAILEGSNNSYTVPDGESGWYRVEVFGQKYGYNYGAYATGIIYMEEKQNYTVDVNDKGTTSFKKSTTILIRAQNADSTRPGGALKCYSSNPNGGDINPSTSDIEMTDGNYNVFNGINMGMSLCSSGVSPSYIRGFVGTTSGGYLNPPVEGKSYNSAVIDGLILPAASNYESGTVIITFLKEVKGETIPPKNKKFLHANKIKVTSNDPSNLGNFKVIYSCSTDYKPGNYTIPQNIYNCGSENKNSVNCEINDICNTLDDVYVVFTDPASYYKNATGIKIELVDNSNITKTIFDSRSGKGYGIPIGDTGIHVSAYQPDSTEDNSIEHGKYYIIPVVYDSAVLTAPYSSDALDEQSLKVEPLDGSQLQKWSIDKNVPPVNNNNYRIMDLARYKALSLYTDENILNNTVKAADNYNSLQLDDTQVWDIKSLHDGTYSIKTIHNSFDNDAQTGFLYADPSDKTIKVGLAKDQATGNNPTAAERFYLYSLNPFN